MHQENAILRDADAYITWPPLAKICLPRGDKFGKVQILPILYFFYIKKLLKRFGKLKPILYTPTNILNICSKIPKVLKFDTYFSYFLGPITFPPILPADIFSKILSDIKWSVS